MYHQQQVSTTMTSQLEYKAALALNNMGVTLLHRSCYNHALSAFQDAFTLMNISLKNNVAKISADVLKSNELASSAAESSLVINQMLLDASTKLARSTTRKVSTNSSKRSDILHPIVLTSDKISNSIIDLLKLSLSSNKCYALRIDDEGTYDDYNDHVNVNDTLIEIAIILTNIGTVYRCYASKINSSSSISSSKSVNRKKKNKLIGVIESGLSFCNAAERILCSIVSFQLSDDDIRRQGLLNLLILHNLIKLSAENVKSDRNNENEILYQDYCFEFCEIQYRMIQKQNITKSSSSSSSSSSIHTTTNVDENNKNHNNNQYNKNNGGSCFYVLNELFFITGARAA